MNNRCALVLRTVVLTMALMAPGCDRNATKESQDAAVARTREAAQVGTPAPYTIQPGDAIAVKFVLNPELDSQLPVRPDGRVSLPMVGEVEVAGAKPDELRDRLKHSYERYLKHPELTVNVVTFGSNVAYIGGEVRTPGIVQLTGKTSALRAVITAGGGLQSGDLKKVVIVRDSGGSEPEIMMVDLSRGLETLASAEDVVLRPRDIVFVPRTGISKANQFVREYIRDLLPIQSSFGVQYNFGTITTTP